MSSGPAAAPAAAAPVTAAAGVAQPQAVAIVDATRIALGQARQALLEAVVDGRSGDGVVTLRTAQGDVQIRTSVPLTAGMQIALELTRNGDQLTGRMLPAASSRLAPAANAPVTGKTDTAATADASARTPLAIARARGADAAQPARSDGFGRTTFPAIVLASSPQGPAPAIQGTPAPQSRGSEAVNTPSGGPTQPAGAAPNAPRSGVQAIDARAASTAAGTASMTPASPDATIAVRAASLYAQARATASTRDARALPASVPAPAAGAPTPPAAMQSVPAPRLQPGTTIELRLSQPAHAVNAGTRQAQPLPATVMGALPQGRLMVDTPVGRLAVAVPPDLLATPPGAMLDLEWHPETSRPPIAAGRQAADGQSTRTWPQTRDAAAALLAHADPAVRATADRLVPKPGPMLAQQMMAFVGRGDGDLARWLGDAMMRQLEQSGLADILTRGDGAATREPDRQSGNGDWRHVTLPLFDGRNLHPIEFRSRRRNEDDRRGNSRDQSRFVVDCVHDELGALQIDGLLTKGGESQRLDVILRSHVELPDTDRLAIASLFADACGAMGFGGEIAFQVAEQLPVVADNPLAHRAVIA